MNQREASVCARRLEIHLAANEFEACRNIIGEAEEAWRGVEGEIKQELEQLDYIHASGLEPRLVSMLEARGCITMQDLEDFLPKLSETKNFGVRSIGKIQKALRDWQAKRALLEMMLAPRCCRDCKSVQIGY